MLNFQHCKDNAFFSFKTEIFEENCNLFFQYVKELLPGRKMLQR